MCLLNELTKVRDDGNSIEISILRIEPSDSKTKMIAWLEKTDGPLYIAEKTAGLAEELAEVGEAQGEESIYYLPWSPNSGLYIDLPFSTNPESRIFLTANLDGCFVGFRNDGDSVRVCHYNFCDIKARKGDFDRYTHWIAPYEAHTSDGTIMNRNEIANLINVSINNITFYNNDKNNRNRKLVTVFGLFDDNWFFANKWRFYLHDSNDESAPVKTLFTN